MKVLFAYCFHENLGVEYLSAFLKRAGHETELVFDPRLFDSSTSVTTNKTLAKWFSFRDQQIDFVRELNPGLVAFSVVGADYLWACKFAEQIKTAIDVPIVFGGRHPTAVPEHVIKLPFVDYLCVGEGEQALVELADAIQQGRPADKIPNIWSKSNGELVGNDPRPLADDLDRFPFPDKELYYRYNPVWKKGYTAQGRRGCLNACTYCGNNAMRRLYFGDDLRNKNYLRLRSVDNLMDELVQRHDKYGYNLIRFVDDDFAANEKWLSEFADKFPAALPDVKYKIFINPLSVNEKTAVYLEKSNCVQVQMGVQSVDPEVRRKFLGRSYSNDVLTRTLSLLRNTRIIVSNDLILGIPWQPEIEQRKIVDFYIEHPVDFVNAFFLQYFPDTDMTKRVLDDNLLDDKAHNEIIHEPADRSIIFRNKHNPASLEKIHCAINNMNYLPGALFNLVERMGPLREPMHGVFGVLTGIYRTLVFWFWAFPQRFNDFPHPKFSFELPGLQDFAVFKRYIWIGLLQKLGLKKKRIEAVNPAKFTRGG